MILTKPVANEEMVRNALGDAGFDELAHPPHVIVPSEHSLWPAMRKALQDVFDPEIPVNIYELGLIYSVAIDDAGDVAVTMSLTSPNCPVAGEMPGMVHTALFPLDGIGEVKVDIVFDPPWDPSRMAETAKLQLNMFF